MALKYRPVQKHPIDMTGDELRRTLGDLPDSQLMRSILIAELEAMRAGAARERRTMRNVWYEVVKPVLSRLGVLNAKTKGNKDVPWPDKMSACVAELVRGGHTSYEEMRIVDGSRQRQVAMTITHPVTDVDLVGAHFPWVVLFTEKDTVWNEVETLASLYGVSAISGSGEPSLACTENTVREMFRHPAYREAQPEAIIVLSLTDYDPFGYKIADAIFDQITEAAKLANESQRGALQQVYHRRLGLVPSQLTPEERRVKAYEPKEVGLEEWFAKTNGVDGEKLGLELDALPLSRLRVMFAEGIEQYIDLEKRREDLREAYLDLIACDILRADFEAKRKALCHGVKSNGLWAGIQGMPISADLFRRAAIAGWGSINPVEDWDLFGCQDKIRVAMSETLQEFGQVQTFRERNDG